MVSAILLIVVLLLLIGAHSTVNEIVEVVSVDCMESYGSVRELSDVTEQSGVEPAIEFCVQVRSISREANTKNSLARRLRFTVLPPYR